MKKEYVEKYIQTFKQIYFHQKEHKVKERIYHVGIVRDTEDYMYRIMNFDDLTIWKTHRFSTFNDAKEFLDKHPHNIINNKGENNND